MISFQVGDLIRTEDKFWRIKGIHLGGEAQESVLHLERPGFASAQIGVRSVDTTIPVALAVAACKTLAFTHYRRMEDEGEDTEVICLKGKQDVV